MEFTLWRSILESMTEGVEDEVGSVEGSMSVGEVGVSV